MSAMTQNRPGFGMPKPGQAVETPQPDEVLDPAAKVDLATERKRAGIDELLASLDQELIGLRPVKNQIREVASLLLVDRMRERFGISASRPSLHMCFTGNPGTGKTTVASRMAELLHRAGYLDRGHLVSVTRDDLVGQYVGHTAPKTKEVLKRAMGGVLFIDEAYYLFRAENERDYGQETIEILLQVMENQREDIVVILAGYADRMDEFFASNPGMASRIAHHIDFPDYELHELVEIAYLMLKRERYHLSQDAEATVRQYLQQQMGHPRFANARSVRNILDRARLRQASRLMDEVSMCGVDELTRLEARDFPAEA